MAWTDACKIEAVAQIDHKVKQGASVREALAELSKESGIPSGTIRRWKYPEPSVPQNGDSDTPPKRTIFQKQAWGHVSRTLRKLNQYMMDNCRFCPETSALRQSAAKDYERISYSFEDEMFTEL